MLKIIKFLILMSVCCPLVSGCAPALRQLNEKMAEPALKINIPDRFFVKKEATPIDIEMVCAGMLNKLRHRGETPFVRFAPAAGQAIGKEPFDYEGFEAILTDITGFEAKKAEKNRVQGLLEGVFHFEDFTGRRASVYFAAKYYKTLEGITIEKAGVTTIAPLFPRVEAYFVPLEAFRKNQKIHGYWEMYAFALENSLDMKPTKEETEAYQAYQSLSVWKKLAGEGKTKKKKLAVMIFCQDRLADVSRFEVTVSEGGRENIIAPSYINEDGWPIAIVAGEFVPDYWGATFDINVYYTPEGGKAKLLIGRFSNQKDYNPRQKQPRGKNAGKSATPTAGEKTEGPIAAGSVFLNPVVKPDAMIIQNRLAGLGYYKSKINGIFGKDTQNSIKKYKQDNGLKGQAMWDIQIQKALFKGSGL